MLPYYEKHQVTISMRGLRPNFRFPGHLHIQCELIWVKKGKMPMICENKEYEIGEGEVFIIFPNQIHAVSGLLPEDVEGYILMFHPEEAAELRGSLLQTKPQHPWLKSEEVEECLRYALEWLAREKANEAVARALLSLIMVKLYEKIEPVEKSASRESDLIRKAMSGSMRPIVKRSRWLGSRGNWGSAATICPICFLPILRWDIVPMSMRSGRKRRGGSCLRQTIR